MLLVGLVIAGVQASALFTQPIHAPLPLHPDLIAAHAPEGRALLRTAVAADHVLLQPVFQTQERPAWCGVASTAIALSALRDPDVAQADVFTDAASAARSPLAATVAGMTLDQLGGLLRAHGLHARVEHADAEDRFRDDLATLADPTDVLLVNYHRPALHQEGGGHISPIAAWDAASDRALVLDVSTYKYPPVWVAVADLHRAMATVDGASGLTRGWVVVRDDGAPHR